MTDLILTIVLVGAAVTYTLETLDAVLMGFIQKTTLNIVLSLPLSLGGMWVMQQSFTVEMFATVPAATFVSLFLVKYLNKPQQVDVRRLPRI